MQKQAVIDRILKDKVIVIVRGVAKEKLLELAQAMYDGGIRLMELTYDASRPETDEANAENIRMLAEHFGDDMLIGAGTVIRERQVELTKQAGGLFIISPDTDETVIRRSVELGLVSMPGALTPTEIQTAHRYGADFVKVFPVSAFGPAYIKDIKAPLSHVRLLAFGGVSERNLAEYSAAGAVGFGIGSTIVNKQMIADGDWAGITALAKKFLAALNG